MTANPRTPEPDQTGSSPDLPATPLSGPAAAAILSAALATCALGVFAVVADGSKTIAHWLTFYRPTGPLSGVTTLTILVWLATWLVLAKLWRTRTVNLSKTNALAFLLLACGLLLTFPPFADLLLRK